MCQQLLGGITLINNGGVGMDKHIIAWQEQVKLVRHTDDASYKVQNVMIPALTDAELDEYVRARSGEVVSYQLTSYLKR